MMTLGCILSPIDKRDIFEHWRDSVPKKYRVPFSTEVINQGKYGTCVACALSTAMTIATKQLKHVDQKYSIGFIWGNRRKTDYQGEGLIVRQALHQLNHDGDCGRNVFPVYLKKYKDMENEITDIMRWEASHHLVKRYFRLNDELSIKTALMKYGAVVLVTTIYKDLGQFNTKPTKSSEVWGDHCMCLVGWDESGWIVQNSHGESFGDKGFCHFTYDYPMHEWWGFEIA